jgi:hypothetical protein
MTIIGNFMLLILKGIASVYGSIFWLYHNAVFVFEWLKTKKCLRFRGRPVELFYNYSQKYQYEFIYNGNPFY